MTLVAIETKDATAIYNFLLDQKVKDVLPMIDALRTAKTVELSKTTTADTAAKTTTTAATTAQTTSAKTKN